MIQASEGISVQGCKVSSQVEAMLVVLVVHNSSLVCRCTKMDSNFKLLSSAACPVQKKVFYVYHVQEAPSEVCPLVFLSSIVSLFFP